ncbi:hypothetical protein F8388_025643 [Cannabis sativa]|uniref:Magnesium transporter n=1 Tax=Cannabis sativa TaxID=3483 RepID=A0A7J6G1U5_CANSA|nr:hypothetical protein F8388_025643 [Cannabis sativa]
MALSPKPYLLYYPLHSPSPSPAPAKLSFCSSLPPPPKNFEISAALFAPIALRVSWRAKCVRSATQEDNRSESDDAVSEDQSSISANSKVSPLKVNTTSSSDSLSLGIREPVYEVVEVKSDGIISNRKINRRQLLKSSGLRPRDIRSVREHAILLNLGSLRAIAMQEQVLIFDYNRRGGKAFVDTLLPRLNPKNINGGPSMPFMLEVVEAALLSRIHRLEQRLMDLEPRVQGLLEVLPNRLTAQILERLRISKQTLVELDSRAGALRQMLLDLLEDPHEIRRICIMGRNCRLKKGSEDLECSVAVEQQIAEEEEEEIEMLLENYLQRCESCHGQAERLLDSAKEMEDSIAVNLSSRRLEVSRVELLLQVGTFCVAVGALVAVCILAHNSWDNRWSCCRIFPNVFLPQEEENSLTNKQSHFILGTYSSSTSFYTSSC